jgi:hypothetical protein
MGRLTLTVLALLIGVTALASPSHTIRAKTNIKKGVWTARAEYFHFGGASPLVQLVNKSLEHDAQQALDDFLKQANEDLKDVPKPDREYAFEEKAKLSLATDNLISVFGDGYQDFAGAHPSQYYSAHAFGIVQGKPKELTLKDLFPPGTNVAATVSAKVLPKLRSRHASGVDDPSIKVLEESALHTFTITRIGITFLFGDSDIASHAEGTFQIKVPFSAFKGKLDPNGPLKSLLANR